MHNQKLCKYTDSGNEIWRVDRAHRSRHIVSFRILESLFYHADMPSVKIDKKRGEISVPGESDYDGFP